MNILSKKKWVSLAILGGAAAMLSGCYVVPINGEPVYVSHPGGGARAMSAPAPAPAPVPAMLQARLYPLNETAGKMGGLTATVSDQANGRAVLTLALSGEMLQGEATRVPAGYPGFGRIHGEVYGSSQMPTGQRGIASATGPKGTYVNCEYALTDAHRGTGACLFSNGAKFQMHFGG